MSANYEMSNIVIFSIILFQTFFFIIIAHQISVKMDLFILRGQTYSVISILISDITKKATPGK